MWTFAIVWAVVALVVGIPAFGAGMSNAFGVATYSGLLVALIVLFGQIVLGRHKDDDEEPATGGEVARR